MMIVLRVMLYVGGQDGVASTAGIAGIAPQRPLRPRAGPRGCAAPEDSSSRSSDFSAARGCMPAPDGSPITACASSASAVAQTSAVHVAATSFAGRRRSSSIRRQLADEQLRALAAQTKRN